jgi:hypothetical protein
VRGWGWRPGWGATGGMKNRRDFEQKITKATKRKNKKTNDVY